jgi:hypothetical protein
LRPGLRIGGHSPYSARTPRSFSKPTGAHRKVLAARRPRPGGSPDTTRVRWCSQSERG